MNQQKPNPAVLSGVFSSFGLAPHLIFLLFLFFAKKEVPLGFFITTYLGTIFFNERLFYEMFKQKTSFFDWIKCVFHPRNPGYVLWAYASEILFDGIFLILAIKFQWNPLNFFLLLFGCKFFAVPVQVFISHFYLSKNASFALAVFTQILCLVIGDKNPEFFLYAVILKGLLCNASAVARSQYAFEIRSQDVG